MLVENLIVFLVVVGLGYVGLRILSVIVSSVAATKLLRHVPFLIATLLIIGMLSIIMFGAWGSKGLFLGWTYLVCCSISLYLTNEIYRKIIAKAFNTLSEKMGGTIHTKLLIRWSEFIGWILAALCFGVIGASFIAAAKMLGVVD